MISPLTCNCVPDTRNFSLYLYSHRAVYSNVGELCFCQPKTLKQQISMAFMLVWLNGSYLNADWQGSSVVELSPPIACLRSYRGNFTGLDESVLCSFFCSTLHSYSDWHAFSIFLILISAFVSHRLQTTDVYRCVKPRS